MAFPLLPVRRGALGKGFRYSSASYVGKGYVVVNKARVAELIEIPRGAHTVAARAAANAAADGIRGNGTGRLARDVRRPKRTGLSSHAIGSKLPYARIQNTGGTIRAHDPDRPLMIHGTGGRGPIVAEAQEVTIKGKHYLALAPPAYVESMMATCRATYRAAGF